MKPRMKRIVVSIALTAAVAMSVVVATGDAAADGAAAGGVSEHYGIGWCGTCK